MEANTEVGIQPVDKPGATQVVALLMGLVINGVQVDSRAVTQRAMQI